jgi:hypothetical protein
MSFYPGQAKNMPLWLRESKLLFIPHVLLIGMILLALVRNSRRKRAERKRATEAMQQVPHVNEALSSRAA